MTTSPPFTLADIVGAWTLQAAVSVGDDGATTHPYGTQPTGMLLYTPDGWMSASISTVGDPPSPGPTYYAGLVDVAGTVVTHTVVVGAEPFGRGTVQPRQAELSADGSRLTLTTPAGQVVRTSIRLTWQRAVRPT